MGKILMRYLLIFFIIIIPIQAAVAGNDVSARMESISCLQCHDSEMVGPDLRKIPREWRTSLHYRNNVACNNCHGGDPQDAALAMSPERGFVGKPKYADVPRFCGKCHLGIMKNYLESGHGKALMTSGKGPNCVVCHGSHNIQKASIDIINEERCSKCHSYDRARTMKAALALPEKKIGEIETSLKRLKEAGIYTEEYDKTIFGIQAEFRTLFHIVNVSLIKEKTDEFEKKLRGIDESIQKTFKEIEFRKRFSAFLMSVFICLGIALFLLARTYRDK